MRHGFGLLLALNFCALGAFSLGAAGCGDDGAPGDGGEDTTEGDDSGGEDAEGSTGGTTDPSMTTDNPTTTFATSTTTGMDTTADDTSGSTTDDETDSESTGEVAGCDNLGPNGLLLWTTLDDEGSITAPMVGAGAGELSTMPANDFVPGIEGPGVQLDEAGEYVRFPQQDGGTDNIDLSQGTIDFCFRPNYDHLDSLNHGLFGTSDFGNGGIRVRKAAGNNANALQVFALGNGGLHEINIPSDAYAFAPDNWYRITISWDFNVAAGDPSVHVYIDGNEVVDPAAPTGPLALPPVDPSGFFYVGSVSDGDPPWESDATFDEFRLYDSALVP